MGATGPENKLVPQAVFDVGPVAARERFACWRESIASIYDVEAAPEVRGDEFTAALCGYQLGPTMLARTKTLGQRFERGEGVLARDGMDHYIVQLFDKGSTTWEAREGTRTLNERGIVVFDLGRPSDFRTSDFINTSLIVPRDLLEERLRPGADHHLRVFEGDAPLSHLLREHLRMLVALAPQMTVHQAEELAIATVGLLAACLNGAVEEDDCAQRRGVEMARTAQVRQLIETHLGRPDLSAAWIARQSGLSRSALYALFVPHNGVAAYVRERRMRRALVLLGRRERPSITEVALKVGYGDATAFARAFRGRYGVSPRDVRERATRRRPISVGPSVAPLDRRYETWMHTLAG